MSRFKIINMHNTIEYTYFEYKSNIIDLRLTTIHEQENMATTDHTNAIKKWTITIDGIDKNVIAHRLKGDYIGIAPTIKIYDEVGINIVKDTRALTAQEWKNEYYPKILDRFNNGVVINGRSIIPKKYRPDIIEVKDGGLGWIRAIYSDSHAKVKKEANSVLKDKEPVMADGYDPAKAKQTSMNVEIQEGEGVRKTRSKLTNVLGNQHLYDPSHQVSPLGERGYISNSEQVARQNEESEKGGAVSE